MQDGGLSSDATFHCLSEVQTSGVGKIHVLFFYEVLQITSKHNEAAKLWSEKSMLKQTFKNAESY